jgi:hypothetical protein
MSKEDAIMPRRPYWMLKDLRKVPEKVVFLNDKNLEQLKGYKAYVQVSRQGEIHITITGLSAVSAEAFFDKLEALNPKEIVSENK